MLCLLFLLQQSRFFRKKYFYLFLFRSPELCDSNSSSQSSESNSSAENLSSPNSLPFSSQAKASVSRLNERLDFSSEVGEPCSSSAPLECKATERCCGQSVSNLSHAGCTSRPAHNGGWNEENGGLDFSEECSSNSDKLPCTTVKNGSLKGLCKKSIAANTDNESDTAIESVIQQSIPGPSNKNNFIQSLR